MGCCLSFMPREAGRSPERRKPRAGRPGAFAFVVCQRSVWQTSRPGWSGQKKYTTLRTGKA
ncbi:hypothetical protein GCM10023088_76520 [Actinomadura verrucosospora]